MVQIQCPIAGCDYTPDNVDNKICAALLPVHGQSHVQAANRHVAIKKPDRLEIAGDMSEVEFNEILFNWKAYKVDANIVGNGDKIRSELQHSCTKEVSQKTRTQDYH